MNVPKECPFCRFEHTVCVPTVHSNGTSAEELYSQLDAVTSDLTTALRTLSLAGPNGRDYYVNDSTQTAIKQHCIRQNKLLEALAELIQMRDHVQEVINFRDEHLKLQ